MANETLLGGGYASGMFYKAPAGTALPTYPGASLDSWTKVGDITEDGITWGTARSFDTLKNWALQVKRIKPGTDAQTVKGAIMDTTKKTMQVLFGDSNVVESAATSEHGNVLTIDTSVLNTPAEAAYLFIMKDGDCMSILGTTNGFITEMDDVTFKGDEAITWGFTISAQEKWTYIVDDGEVES